MEDKENIPWNFHELGLIGIRIDMSKDSKEYCPIFVQMVLENNKTGGRKYIKGAKL